MDVRSYVVCYIAIFECAHHNLYHGRYLVRARKKNLEFHLVL